MDHIGPLVLIVGMAVIAFVVLGLRSSAGGAPAASAGPGTRQPTSPRARMAADIRATKTSRVADEVAILDELSQTSPGFRQYCELVGTAQAAGGVTALYSRREVAYYEIRCYRIENRGGGDVETLVAHEKSFDPFYFTDASSDERIYVDLDTFGDNVILVNSTNHVEGPNSDFARAADAAGGRGATTSATGTSAVSAAVGAAAARAATLLAQVACASAAFCQRACAAARALARRAGDAVAAVARALSPQALAFAGAAADQLSRGPAPSFGVHVTALAAPPVRRAVTVSFVGPAPGGRRAPAGPGRPAPRRGAGPRHDPRPGAPAGFGPGMPSGMGDFLGGPGIPGGFSGVPRPRPRPSSGGGDVLVGMALGSLLTSLATGASQGAAPTSSFRGYRLVEDVVPLGSPVYCIGELHRSGRQVHMARSLSTDYPTSYFATRPEAEVLSTLSS